MLPLISAGWFCVTNSRHAKAFYFVVVPEEPPDELPDEPPLELPDVPLDEPLPDELPEEPLLPDDCELAACCLVAGSTTHRDSVKLLLELGFSAGWTIKFTDIKPVVSVSSTSI